MGQNRRTRYNDPMRAGIILIGLIISSTAVHAARGIPLYQELRRSIVSVQGLTPLAPSEGRVGLRTTWGAGVILDKDGVIATNTHVIYGATYVRITLASGEKVNAAILQISPDQDLSLLKILPPRPLVPVNWADSDLVQLGDEVITIGHSELLKNTISGGHVRAMAVRKGNKDATREFLELDINHYEGDSGGPVFDREGNFLGIMNAKRTGANRACQVIPSNKVRFAYINLAQGQQNR